MLTAVICERFGWTWQEFNNQPVKFIRTIMLRLEAESQEARAVEQRAGVSRVVG